MTPLAERVDGRVALAAALASILVTVLTPVGCWTRLSMEALLVGAWLAASRAPARWLLRRLAVLLPFIILAAVSVPFMRAPGSHPPLERLAWTLFRMGISFGALAALFQTVPVSRLLDALARIRTPAIFVTLMALILRYLSVLEEEALRMVRARDVRGQPPTLRSRARVTGEMVGSLFVRSFERAERVSWAMQARGFTGHLPPPPPRRLAPADLALLIGVLVVQAGLLWLH